MTFKCFLNEIKFEVYVFLNLIKVFYRISRNIFEYIYLVFWWKDKNVFFYILIVYDIFYFISNLYLYFRIEIFGRIFHICY